MRQHESVKIHSEDPSRGRVEGSEGGQVPEKYIVVRNNDLLHIRYRVLIVRTPAGGGWMAARAGRFRRSTL